MSPVSPSELPGKPYTETDGLNRMEMKIIPAASRFSRQARRIKEGNPVILTIQKIEYFCLNRQFIIELIAEFGIRLPSGALSFPP